MKLINDPFFTVDLISKPNLPAAEIAYWAAHQDYSADYVGNQIKDGPLLSKEIDSTVINMLLKGDRGHYGPLEHAQFVFAAGYFPHTVMQQARTHRHLSFDVQSFRYTGKHISDFIKEVKLKLKVSRNSQFVIRTDQDLIDYFERLIYLRPIGEYTDRSGKSYQYTSDWRDDDFDFAISAVDHYYKGLQRGKSLEHARGLLPFDFRQHFVFSGNLRSLFHLFDLRLKRDAQLETTTFAQMTLDELSIHEPGLCDWYKENRKLKARLAP